MSILSGLGSVTVRTHEEGKQKFAYTAAEVLSCAFLLHLQGESNYSKKQVAEAIANARARGMNTPPRSAETLGYKFFPNTYEGKERSIFNLLPADKDPVKWLQAIAKAYDHSTDPAAIEATITEWTNELMGVEEVAEAS